jgi:hypothetical protein
MNYQGSYPVKAIGGDLDWIRVSVSSEIKTEACNCTAEVAGYCRLHGKRMLALRVEAGKVELSRDFYEWCI